MIVKQALIRSQRNCEWWHIKRRNMKRRVEPPKEAQQTSSEKQN